VHTLAATFWVTLGALLIAAVYADIFFTVLHPNVESPLSNRFQKLVWWLLRLFARALPERKRDELLSAGLPLMVAGLIALWLALFTIGFACVYLPWIGDGDAFAADTFLRGDFFDAFYYSGVTLATLGYGDILPLTRPLRALAVLQAITGAVSISASVAYILAVYPALAQQRTLARALNAEVAGQSDALPMLRRYLASDGAWHADLFAQLRHLALNLMAISESHETHSVLYYAHPVHVQHSFLRVLITAQSLVGTLRYGLSVDAHPDTVQHPHLLLLEQSLHFSLNQLSASMHTGQQGPSAEAARQREYAAAFATLCAEVEAIGLVSARRQRSPAVPVLVKSDAEDDRPDEQAGRAALVAEAFTFDGHPPILDPALDLGSRSSEAAFVVFRAQTDPLLEAYAAACSYDIADARATSATHWWTGKG
jgi:hypothetical protein